MVGLQKSGISPSQASWAPSSYKNGFYLCSLYWNRKVTNEKSRQLGRVIHIWVWTHAPQGTMCGLESAALPLDQTPAPAGCLLYPTMIYSMPRASMTRNMQCCPLMCWQKTDKRFSTEVILLFISSTGSELTHKPMQWVPPAIDFECKWTCVYLQ